MINSIFNKVWNRFNLTKKFIISVLLNGFTNEVIRNKRIRRNNTRNSVSSISSTGDIIPASNSGTSISDSSLYLEYATFCELASQNDGIFTYFRSHPAYREVLEHVPHYLAIQYSSLLKHKLSYSKTLEKIDRFGTPWKYHYRLFGEVSPTALRYCYFTEIISELLPGVDFKSICEIGGGFGGQILALSDRFQLEKVTLVDIPSALSLTSRFLNSVGIDFELYLNSPDQANERNFDLLISNYAFSELNRQYQDWYLENYVLRAKSGFILWNNLSFIELDGYPLDSLISIIPGARKVPEVPLSFEGNTIIFWHN